MPAIDMLLGELAHEAVATRKVLERVPADKLDWRPHPKSMSLGQLSLHIAVLPGNIARLAMQDMSEAVRVPLPPATSTGEVLSALEASLKSANETLHGMSDEKLNSTWRMQANGKELLAIPRAALLRSIMLNHWYHHRGQLTVYLRELGVPLPSVYGPTADENPFG